MATETKENDCTPKPLINVNLKTCTVFQWNARGLRSKLADFQQLVRTYRFPFIVICESRVKDDFRLKNYHLLHSRRSNGISRLFVAFRNDVPVAEVDVPTHETEEYICAKTMIGTKYFTFIAAYIEPGNGFNP